MPSAARSPESDLALAIIKRVVAENLDARHETWTEKLGEQAKAECLGEYRPGY